MIFIDTSAFLAVLDAAEQRHADAHATWVQLITQAGPLVTSNYVIVETTALTQHRLGMEAVRAFQQDIMPLVQVVWIDEYIHAATTAALLAANRHQLSLVDCSSFEVMRRIGATTAFTLDRHFDEQGFSVIP